MAVSEENSVGNRLNRTDALSDDIELV